MRFQVKLVSPAGTALYQVYDTTNNEERGTFKSESKAQELADQLNSEVKV